MLGRKKVKVGKNNSKKLKKSKSKEEQSAVVQGNSSLKVTSRKISKERRAEIMKALGHGGRLDIPQELREEGFYYRWVSSEKPHRIPQLEKIGYIKVKDQREADVTRYGGMNERGHEYSLYLMRIEDELKEEIEEIKLESRHSNMKSVLTKGLDKNDLYVKKGEGDPGSLLSEFNIKQL